MRNLMLFSLSFLSVVMINKCIFADEKATREDVVAMVESAVARIKAVGAEKAAREFMEDDRKWKAKGLYISMYNIKKNRVVVVAHGMDQKLIGKDLTGLRDADGKLFLQEALKLAQEGGWVYYKWPDPVTRKLCAKASYILKVPRSDYAILVGVNR